METEIIDKLFLELSQVTQAKTGRELYLARELLMAEERAQKWRDELSQVLTERDAAIKERDEARAEVERLENEADELNGRIGGML
jgi:predicted  nucleic acid-binding Zn-ribbon protein